MCGKFAQVDDISKLLMKFEIDKIISEVEQKLNLLPQDSVNIIEMDSSGKRVVDRKIWGVVNSWSSNFSDVGLYNIRSEKLFQEGSSVSIYNRSRGIIPVTGFFENRKVKSGKVPYFFRNRELSPMGLAAITSEYKGINYCSIITISPNKVVSKIHNRMPLILTPEQYKLWLEGENINSIYPETLMEGYEVTSDSLDANYCERDMIEPLGLF